MIIWHIFSIIFFIGAETLLLTWFLMDDWQAGKRHERMIAELYAPDIRIRHEMRITRLEEENEELLKKLRDTKRGNG